MTYADNVSWTGIHDFTQMVSWKSYGTKHWEISSDCDRYQQPFPQNKFEK